MTNFDVVFRYLVMPTILALASIGLIREIRRAWRDFVEEEWS